MFSSIFTMLEGLSSHTALLESCDWSEEKLNLLLNQFSEIINSMSHDQFNSYDDFEKSFYEKVESFTTEDQRDIMKNLLKREFSKILEGEHHEHWEN
jgi:hypothetical protein